MIKRTLAILCIAFASSATAAEYNKRTTIVSFGAHDARPALPALANNDFIQLAEGAWSPGGSCSQTSVVLPDNNPTMRAIALAAVASGATIYVTVDDTSPLIHAGITICQVTTIYFERS